MLLKPNIYIDESDLESDWSVLGCAGNMIIAGN